MRSSAVLLLVALASIVGPVEASAFPYTHRIEISGGIVDNWTTSDPASCGSNGDGSLKVSFTTKASTKIRPYVSKFGARPRSKKLGVWTLGVPGGGFATHMGYRNANATITTVDNTVQGPNTLDPTQPCPPPEKDGCGARPLVGTKVLASGWDRRYLYSALAFKGDSFRNTTSCRVAGLDSWTFPHAVAGGVNRFSDLLLKMPSAKTLRSKRVTVISASDHHTSSSRRSENGTETFTDDVTRSMTLTITKL